VKTTIVSPARERVVYHPVTPADPKFPSSRGVLRVRASGVMATRIE
jgi:hypothetical protein